MAFRGGYTPVPPQVAEDLADASATAYQALTAGLNARQMVLNRDPRLTSLESVASEFGSVTQAADTVHADLYAKYDAAIARTMTPGPQGPPGTSVKGDKGDPGTPADMTRVSVLETANTSAKSRLDKLEARALTLQTQRSVTAVQVALNGAVTFSVNWPTPFPDSAYQVGLTQSPAVTNVVYSNQTATGVTVSAKAAILIAIGSVFTVEAIRYA